MNLLHPPTLKALCARADLRPSKAAGQNFLIHGGTLAAIVDAVAPQRDETIVEVGAGFGVLTRALAERAARVIAIERDRRIVPILREQVTQYPWVEVVEGDVLALLRSGSPFRMVLRSPWSLVANLPYSITSDFLRLLFDAIGTGALPPPERVVLLLQHEVVERLLGRTPADVGLLTMIARLHCARIHRIAKVPASHFWPAPKVASAVVVLEGWRSPEEIEMILRRSGELQLAMSGRPTVEGGIRSDGGLKARRYTRSAFLSLLSRAFSHPRRQLQNNLDLPPTAWAAAGVAPTARPATVILNQWIALAREMM